MTTLQPERIAEPLSDDAYLASAPGDDKVYLITWGEKKLIEDQSTMSLCGFDKTKIVVDPSILSLPDGYPIGVKA